MGMHWADYVIMVAFLMTSMAIGIFHALTGGRQRTTAEFIMADRNSRVLPTVLSLVVSYLSALLIVGGSAEMYNWGSHMSVVICLSYSGSLILSERIIVPWLYPLKLTSVYEYFELRFQSKTVRVIGSIIGIAWGVLYMGIAIYAPSIALEIATGFPLMASIPLMSIICTVYTAIGGIKAVIWTDVFQFLVMMGGMAAVLIKGSMLTGGPAAAIDRCSQEGRLIWYNFDFDPRTRVTTWGILGMICNFTYQYGFQQASFQRYTATPKIRDSRLVLLLCVPGVFLMFTVAYSTGLFVFAYYSMTECDPIASGQVDDPNQLLGLFVSTVFKKNAGFMGFFLATLYSGALSSVSSSLSGAAANTWEDMLKWKFYYLSDYKATLINKGIVVLYGFVGAGIAYMAAEMPGPVSQIVDAFLGAAGGPLLGMFLLGGLFSKAEWIGTAIGGALSFIISLWICIMGSLVQGHSTPLPPTSVNGCAPLDLNTTTLDTHNYMYTSDIHLHGNFSVLSIDTTASKTELSGIENLYAVSFLWYAPMGMILCMLIGLPISLLLQCINKSEKVPDYLFIDWREMFKCTCNEEKLRGYKVAKTEVELEDIKQTNFG